MEAEVLKVATLQKRSLTTDEKALLILMASILFGTWFRIMPVQMTAFPMNDGGMFYSMMADLQQNNFIPPLYTSYNNLNIPFAYPPFGLYVGAILSSILGISGVEILRWLPAVVNSLCIPAFYLFSKEISGDKMTAAFATLVFSFTPHLTTWLSAGGGLTRSFGMFFLILTVFSVYRLLQKDDARYLWLSILFGSLTLLSHPEAAVYAVALSALVWLTTPISLKGMYHALLVALGVASLAGIWYGWVIYHHGLNTLLAATQTGGHSPWSVLKLLNLNLNTEEPYVSLFGAAGLLGIAFLIISKKHFIPMMLLVIYIVQPRSAHVIANLPLALASGFLIAEVFLPVIKRIDSTINPNRNVAVFLFLLTPFVFANSTFQALTLSQNHLAEGEVQAMQWVKENTPEDSQFLVLSTEGEAWCDSSGEWFPALSGRKSLTTLQGREWLIGRSINEFAAHKMGLRACFNQDVACLEGEMDSYFGSSPDYIYVSTDSPTQNCSTNTESQKTSQLISALNNSVEYSIVYNSPEAIVYKTRPGQ